MPTPAQQQLLDIIARLDAIEAAERSVMDDPQALIDLSDQRATIRELVDAAPASPYLSLTPENTAVILRAAAETWHARCAELSLKPGTKGRERELASYLQGVLAVATAARLVTRETAHRCGFMVAIGRAEELVQSWAKG